jgi:hypothetical protein
MLTGELSAIIKEHQDIEIRDVIFHPYRPLLFSCSDGNCIYLYMWKYKKANVYLF